MGNFVRVPKLVRAFTRDNLMTYDAQAFTVDSGGNHVGRTLGGRFRTHDARFVDSTGAFMVGELERLDMTLHEPLSSVSWGRDIDLREDVTIADDVTSFTQSSYASAGGLGSGNGIGNGKAWMGKATNQITGVGVDIAKVTSPLRPWAIEVKYTILELESAAKMGRPLDSQKYSAMQLKYQMDIDEQVYYGDPIMGDVGLVNIASVSNVTNAPNGASGFPQWSKKTADEILADFNTVLNSVWAASAWAVIPNRVLIPPAQFGILGTGKVSQAGNVSILKYVEENNVMTASGRGMLKILPTKWTIGAGVGGTIGSTGTVDRMVVYTKKKEYVRYPMTTLDKTPVQYDGMYHKATYYCKLGRVECVYPETVGYMDGI